MHTFAPLRNILAERGISLRQLARDCQLSSNSTVALNNDHSVRLEVIIAICVHLNVSIEEVIEIKR